ncbi:MAG: zinc-binding dehydrogenase [Anaerolineaceae bacterium]|nr:zinc-binding dehydrogenase [Anaerolineaceae bacterium]MDD4043455.1 zinc-binding dehydrogenase [Anaerolineaceae bacterium]
MDDKFRKYIELDYSLPEKVMGWNMYGAGLENVGRGGKPELFAMPKPGPDQILVRVDAVGLCFSDVKLVKQGGQHPKLYNRDLSVEPTRLGHEAAFTVIKVGENLQGRFTPGQKLAIQPDIYVNKVATAYGYTIPGGLIQYHLVGKEIFDADDPNYLIPVQSNLGYSESALTEPWACVEAAYTQRRRLTPLDGGLMWINGPQDSGKTFTFEIGLEKPGKIFLSNTNPQILELVRSQSQAEVIEVGALAEEQIAVFAQENTHEKGFDDIILLEPKNSELVSEAAKQIAFRGTLNIVSDEPLDGLVVIDAGRIHYHYTTYIGTTGTEISAAYGEERNRSELMDGGLLVVVGGAGPMGQMHVQRSLELVPGPKTVVVTDINDERLQALRQTGDPIAEKNGKQLILVNTGNENVDLVGIIRELSGGKMAEDVVVCVPNAKLMENAALLLGKDGMLNFFAGVPNGTTIQIDLNNIFLNNIQLTGTSGSSVFDQKTVMSKATSGALSPNLSVAAIGGLKQAVAGMDAMMAGTFTGKIIIYPQLEDLPLLSLAGIAENYPKVAEKMGPNHTWTREAEKVLIEEFWKNE